MIDILNEMKNDFLVYAQEVNQNRSFPDVRDGLKPSQRAALYTLYRKGFTVNKPHVKSAKVTGAIIGELWPHGDSSAYESIVRMSQEWINNIPEVDFHGANGSLLGGPEAASSRYTECRLSQAAEDGLFSGIKKNVVDMIPNFSEDDEWPKVLPALMPRLFINGSQGIGYTIAQEWEPGNLIEFTEKVKEYIKKNKITYTNIYPDYPTGGIIINKQNIADIYKTGRGTIILRGTVNIVDNYINITELPYQVYAEPFIQKIKDLVNNGTLSGIEDICNKSDDRGLLIEIECSDDPKRILSKLYKLTDLQVTFAANQMALVDSIPAILSLQDYIKIYIEHNILCLQKEYKFDLDRAETRLEIVIGLLKAISIIDTIIKLIKQSKSAELAKQELITKFKFTENQAKAIIDMRLGKLANLEQTELQTEEMALKETVKLCKEFLTDIKLQQKEFIKRLTDFTKNYGKERHTIVTDIDLEEEKTITKADKVIENYMISIKDNYIKRIALSQYKLSKDVNDITIQIAENQRFILVSNTGMMYKLETKDIQKCSLSASGTDLHTLLNLSKNEKIINLFTGQETGPYMFFITKCGLVKKMLAEEVFTLSKKLGTPIMKVNTNDAIIYCKIIQSEKIKVKYNKKDKYIDTDKFNLKKRLAGGIVAIKTKLGQYITV